MTRLPASTTYGIDAAPGSRRFTLDPDVVDLSDWPCSLALRQERGSRDRAGDPTPRTIRYIMPYTESFALLKNATEQPTVAGVSITFLKNQTCVVLGAVTGTLLSLDARGDFSDFTDKPLGDDRWMTIVREGLGMPEGGFPIVKTEADQALSDWATVDCITFCKAHGILEDLRKCLDKAQEQFSKVVAIKAELDQFPSDEYEEEGHVHISIQVAADQDTTFREYDEYTAWALDAIEDDKIHYFLPTVSRVDDKPE